MAILFNFVGTSLRNSPIIVSGRLTFLEYDNRVRIELCITIVTMKVTLAFVLGVSLGRLFDSWSVLFQEARLQILDQQQQRSLPDEEVTTQASSFTKESDGPVSGDHGWKNIQVFHGSAEWPIPRQGKRWYSQAKQDEIVVELLHRKKEGFFIDLAANHAINLSNTLALERSFEWNGVCIEANPMYWYDLSKYRTCQIFGAVVGGARDQELEFVFPINTDKKDKGVHGGILGFDNEENDTKFPTKREKIRTVTFSEILERALAPTTIDYLSLDVEGAESLIMKDFPFDKYTIKILTVERPKEDLQTLLKDKGYEFVKTISYFQETLWVHSSFKHELDLGRFQA